MVKVLIEPRVVDKHAFVDRSFSFTGPRLYNGLPLEI